MLEKIKGRPHNFLYNSAPGLQDRMGLKKQSETRIRNDDEALRQQNFLGRGRPTWRHRQVRPL